MDEKEEQQSFDEGVNNMAVLARPVNISLRVQEDKTKEFLSIGRDTLSMLNRFKRLKRMAILSNTSPSDKEIDFLDRKIQEFENELKG